jgi:hypothetical protein
VENVLVKSSKEKYFVATDGSAQRESELLLLIVRLEVKQRMGCAKSAIADEIEIRAMEMVRAGLGDHIDYCSSGSS